MTKEIVAEKINKAVTEYGKNIPNPAEIKATIHEIYNVNTTASMQNKEKFKEEVQKKIIENLLIYGKCQVCLPNQNDNYEYPYNIPTLHLDVYIDLIGEFKQLGYVIRTNEKGYEICLE